ncbi:MAG: ATP-binding protein [Pseudomonadota bacterium]
MDGNFAMKLCPCGNRTDPNAVCRCSADQIQRYQGRLSGPFLDRIDMHIEVPRVERDALQSVDETAESSYAVRERVTKARAMQLDRCGKINSQMDVKDIDKHCALGKSDMALLDQAMQRLNLSARAFHRVLKVARTVADLSGDKNITTASLTEAVSYRSLDRG